MRISLFLFIALVFSSCQKKPTACIAVPDTVDAGFFIELKNCSENYEFLTWKFGDSSFGQIDDSPSHKFSEEKTYLIQLEAFAKNGYKSDFVSKEIFASFRYIDRIEIIGKSNFERFIISGAGVVLNANGDWTENTPFEYIAPLLQELPGELSLSGINQFGVTTRLATKTYDYSKINSNPLLVDGTGFTMKVYWRYKERQ